MSNPTTGRTVAIQRLRGAMIEKKLTQAELADAADCHEKTVQNMLAGRTVRDQTLFDCCMVLGLEFEAIKALWQDTAEGAAAPGGGTMDRTGRTGVDRAPESAGDRPGEPTPDAELSRPAPVYMGAYTRAGVEHLIGSYLTLRPAFSQATTIIAYKTVITWDDTWPSLLFEEQERPDAPFAHRGRLHVPPSSPFIHLVSLTKGAMRMVTVSQRDQLGLMRGIISTLGRHRAAVTPVAAPVVLAALPGDGAATTATHEVCVDAAFGEIARGHPAHDRYQRLLSETTRDGYARLIDGGVNN